MAAGDARQRSRSRVPRTPHAQQQVRRVVGFEVDRTARSNRCVDEFRLIGPDGGWPLEDASAPLAVVDWVIEHVDDSNAFLGEATRVPRPRGHLCTRTINARGYVGLASRLVPSWRHHAVLGRFTFGREGREVFATKCRWNTIRKQRRPFERAGFEAVVHVWRRSYLRRGQRRIVPIGPPSAAIDPRSTTVWTVLMGAP